MRRSFFLGAMLAAVFLLGACSKNAENEHLPEYCQTYAGFASTASRDMFELLDDAGYSVNRFNYLSVISEIELEFELDDPSRTVDLGGIQCFQNLTSLSLIGRSFKDISEISALSNIQSIELRNTSIVSIDSFKNLSKINNLVISETKTLQNVEGVGEMTKLTTLDLSDNGLINIGELNALVNLQHLYLDNNEIVYFPSINNLEQLETLDISYNNIIQLGEDLSGLRNLEELNASHNEICDISTLDDLESVELLDLSHNDLGCVEIGVSPDFDSLENAPNLSTLKLNDNGLTSIEGLRDRDISLEVLHLHNNRLTDITPISAYTNITELVLYGNLIVNIDNLSGMTGLTSIDLSNNQITDFSDLMLIPNLTSIDLSFNNISVIPDISGAWANLSVLDLNSNDLTDVSGVEGHPSLEALIIYNNGLTVLEGISNLPNLDQLVVETPEDLLFNEENINPNEISILINSFNELPSLDIHDDHVLDLGFTFGPDVEIYDSITGNITIAAIDWDQLDINIINENSIQLPNLAIMDVRINNLTDIRFILGNPNLTELYLSNNPITNLDVISGVGTDDLDDLEVVEARNIFIGNALDDAFLELPRLDTIDLTNTSLVSINNSFNDLGALQSLALDDANLTSIIDSFNNLFSTYRTTNQILFNTGRIRTISNSFNGGEYNTIEIQNQNPTFGAATIDQSFNNLSILNEAGMHMNNSRYDTITDSFNGIVTDSLSISNSGVASVSGSFIASEIGTLILTENLLTDLPLINLVTSLTELDLSGNRLSTVSFVDSIPDLEEFIFDDQTIGVFSTLATIDGINNQPLIDTINGDLSAVTTITGLQNTGITFLNLSLSNLDGSSLTSIGVDAFSGSPITTLDLSGHALSDLTFLQNLTVVETLYIGMDVADLSDFNGLPMTTTLEILLLNNASPISDFAPLAEYDALDTLGLPDNTTNIVNLDDMDSLVSLILVQDSIETITDSFNIMPSWEPSADYLFDFSALTAISGSFDLIGSPSNIETHIILYGDYTITDSFHNVNSASVLNNEGDISPTFDTLSFTNINQIDLDSADYTSYAFLNGYLSLETILISTLGENMIGLNNANVTNLTIGLSENSVASIDAVIAEDAEFEITTNRSGVFDLNINAQDVTILANNANVTWTTSNDIITSLRGNPVELTLNGSNLTTIEFTAFAADDIVLNTPLLSTITRSSGTSMEVTQLDVNADTTSMNIDVDADTLNLYNGSLTSATLNNDSGVQVIHDGGTNLSLNATGSTVSVLYDTVTSVSLSSGAITDLIIDSDALTTVDTTIATIGSIQLTSGQAALDVNGSNVSTVSLIADSLTSLTATTFGADWILDTNQTSVTLDDTSNIAELDLTNSGVLDTLVYGSAAVSNILLDSTSATMSITGSSATFIEYDSLSLSNLTINAPSPAADVSLNGSQATLTVDGTLNDLNVESTALVTFTLDGTLNDVTIDSTTLATLNVVALSTINELVVENGDALSTIQTNDSLMTLLDITTGVTSITVDASNATSGVLNGNSLDTVVFDVGTNNAQLTTGSSTLDLTATATQFSLTTGTTSVTIDNASTITTLPITAANLTTLTTGTASIDTLNINDSSNTLTINGSGINTVNISDLITTLNANLDPTTDLTLTSTSITSVLVNTTTTGINLSASVDSTINGGALDTVLFSLGANNLSLDMDAPTLNAELSGTADTVTITGDDIDAITFSGSNTIDTLILTNLDISSLDTTGQSISNIDVTTTLASMSITAPTASQITLDGSNLTSVDLSNNTGTTTLTTNQNTLALSGSIATLELTNNTLTSLDLSSATIETLDLTATAMVAFNTFNAITSSLSLSTNQNNFSLTTNVSNVTFDSDTTYGLDLTSTLVGTMTLITNTDSIEFNAINTTFDVTGANLTTIDGVVDAIDLSGFTTTSLTFDLDASNVNLKDPGTLTSLSLTGARTITELQVESSGALTTIETNSVTITTIGLHIDATVPLTVTTLANDIDVEAEALGGFTDVSLVYNGTLPLGVSFDTLTFGSVTLSTASTLNATGTVSNLTVIGAALDNFNTTTLAVSNDFTMNNTLITTLDFASASLLSGLSQLEMNTLSSGDIEDILTALDGPTLTLISPITSGDVYDHYYDTRHAELTNQEAIDNARYDNFRSIAVNESWAEVLLNEYMDHLDETATKTEIDTDTMQTVDDYLDSYLTDAGITIGDLEAGEETTIRNAIQATLDGIALIMDETDLQTEVTDSIVDDATTYATTQSSAITFTIG